MNSPIPIQFSTKVELWNSAFREVLVCFTPLIRAGCDPDLNHSYVSFIFKPLNPSAKTVEYYFMPRVRWTEQHELEWKKVMLMLPTLFDINESFSQTTIDMVL